ncbi:MAG: chromosome partitioning protein ParA [Aliivibrio sp.]|uniref:chromosome partitioning protein ParA n=1 Tax=Aliivibrio sp. TaxID=1872443 RepID=UPI001A3CF65E|nr:chromosome partitioning protein ParA [Aliivibrio sp.]
MKSCIPLFLLLLIGCNESDKETSPDAEGPITNIPKTPELIQELQAQPTIDDQLSILYQKFEPMLDRSDSLTGPDDNSDGIRDDIEAFINALEVTEPERNALKQDARQTQENLYYDFSVKTDENEVKAIEIARKYERVVACKDFVGMSIDDLINTSRTVVALTYNTKARTMAYLAYNRILDGTVSTSLKAEARYCE